MSGKQGHHWLSSVFTSALPPRPCTMDSSAAVVPLTCRLLLPLEGLSEGVPLLVELFDKDFRAKEWLGQASMPWQ